MDRVDKIISFEDGSMENEDVIIFIQELIDDGSAFTLQGIYGRIALSLIRSGLCHHKGNEDGKGKEKS